MTRRPRISPLFPTPTLSRPRAPPGGRPPAPAAGGGAPLGTPCPAAARPPPPPRYARAAAPAVFDVALRLVDDRSGGVLAYAPTAAAVDGAVASVAREADLLLFDGTFWSDGELRAAGVDAPAAREMGHLPVGGPGGGLDALPRLGARRTVLVHVNNTNPMLGEDSAERRQVEAAGLEVGDDGVGVEVGARRPPPP